MDTNVTYWRTLHRKYPDQIRAVGHPWLSEAFNRLKYTSETETLMRVLDKVLDEWGAEDSISIFDIGAGSGYWTLLLFQLFGKCGKRVRCTALDVSQDALDVLRSRQPWVETVCEDLKTVTPDRFQSRFDLVTSFYCLHHLVRVSHFFNALNFAARSVKSSGFLLLMDPILTLPYSRFDAFEFNTWKGNGVPRHLYLIDDVLSGHGFTRCRIVPAVSFLLNGPIEAKGFLQYTLLRGIWSVLQKVGISEKLTLKSANHLLRWDRWFKRKRRSYSSSVCVYQKISDPTLNEDCI
jgi:SAM-dependent methyltransferase